MNSTTTNLSISNLDALIGARLEERMKVKQALDAANAAYEQAKLLNKARKEIVAEQVSKLQKELDAKIKEELQIKKTVYNKTLVDLKGSPERFPIECAVMAADKNLLTPALETVGKAAKLGFDLFNGVKARVMQGFKS